MAQVKRVATLVTLLLVPLAVVLQQHPAVAKTASGRFVAPDQRAGIFGEVLRHGRRHVDGLGWTATVDGRIGRQLNGDRFDGRVRAR
uniref:Putative secreted protein n=1 Tax=Anopheles darlingi TaxID=43151 RepID=A0A2M4DIE7_ANODA